MIRKLGLQPPPMPGQVSPTIPTAPAVKSTTTTQQPGQKTNLPPSQRVGGATLPYSPAVKEMQAKMYQLAQEIKKDLPELDAASDKRKYEQTKGDAEKVLNKAKELKIDPSILEKINAISTNLASPDGLWGEKTHEALAAINSYGKAFIGNKSGEEIDAMGKGFNPVAQKIMEDIATEPISSLSNLGADKMHKLVSIVSAFIDSTIESTSKMAQFIKNTPETKEEKKDDLPPNPYGEEKSQEGQPAAQQVPGQNPQAQQVAYQQSAEKSVQNTVQQVGGTGTFTLPFDLSSDLISITRFRDFLLQANALLGNTAFMTEMGSYASSLRSNIANTEAALTRWQQLAKNTAAEEGGFTLSVSDTVAAFVDTFADNNYVIARNLLNQLEPICIQLSNICSILNRSSLITGLVGQDILSQQAARGRSYISRLQGQISQVNSILTTHHQ